MLVAGPMQTTAWSNTLLSNSELELQVQTVVSLVYITDSALTRSCLLLTNSRRGDFAVTDMFTIQTLSAWLYICLQGQDTRVRAHRL